MSTPAPSNDCGASASAHERASVRCDALTMLLARWRDRMGELQKEWEVCGRARDQRGMSQVSCEMMQIHQCHDELTALMGAGEQHSGEVSDAGGKP